MADCIYLLVLQMLKDLIPGLTEDEWCSISTATDYIIFFHTLFYLKSPLAAQAPNNDLRGIKLAFELMTNSQLTGKYGRIGKALHDSILRHPWYLTPQCVIFAIADVDLDINIRKKILTKLLTFHEPKAEEFEREKPELVGQVSPLSNLDDFVSQESFLFFNKLGISKQEIENWDVDHIDKSSTFTKFVDAVKNVAVVNDRAERHIRLVQDFIRGSNDENVLQDTLQVVTENRKKLSKDATKKDYKY